MSDKPSLEGLLKHANVVRWLIIHRLTPYEFYIPARLCQEHLPAPTIQELAREMRRLPEEAFNMTRRLERAGLIRIDRNFKPAKLEPTLEGWRFYYLLLADMEAPITDSRVFSKTSWYPKKKNKKGKHNNCPHGARSKAYKRGALPRKPGLSIWEQSGLPPLPKFQRQRRGERASSRPAS